MPAAETKRLALEFLQAFWDGDPERGYALCAPHARWQFQRTLHEPREVPVREAVEWLTTKLVAGFDPDSGYRVELRDAIAEGDEAAVEYAAIGRTRRGETYHNHYVVRFTVEHGRIVSIRPYFDTHLCEPERSTTSAEASLLPLDSAPSRAGASTSTRRTTRR